MKPPAEAESEAFARTSVFCLGVPEHKEQYVHVRFVILMSFKDGNFSTVYLQTAPMMVLFLLYNQIGYE